ncbi:MULTISPECIES: hypothetical protein [Luteimonas]|uniref:Uncharacterized protein n=1 Tax=Luteimonas chenhongjianii TaxID=2006110 RepID=A0A290XBN3_9GAMM|nr:MULTISPECIES: hypothetical protein [Luteimonas]ATD66547.1 hypothetical protein CNR27_02995 [Luteimonas chenhongjianii]RPD85219.1 hypothetical protein EGK76_09885 [Luteimonas sp. 100069]
MHNDPHHTSSVQQDLTPADAAVAGEEALEAQFKPGLAQAPYYSAGRHWDDYAPAYRYGRDCRQRHAGRRFDEIEAQLEHGWDAARGHSRLGWVEARGAVEDAWARATASNDPPCPSTTRQSRHDLD